MRLLIISAAIMFVSSNTLHTCENTGSTFEQPVNYEMPGPLATSYYVSPTGNDAADGKTQATAWRTLTKVQGFAFATGDQILFQRGGKWNGTWTFARGNITIDAYGSGVNPIISGWQTMTGWVPTGGGKWFCNFTAYDTTFCTLAIDGTLQQMARYPDFDAAAKGYLSYDTVRLSVGSGAGNGDSIRIKGTEVGNWQGKRMVLRPNDWRIENVWVNRDSADYLSFKNYEFLGNGNNASLEYTKDNHGYFFVDDTTFLTKFGEFKYQKNLSRLYVYFGAADPNAYLVQASNAKYLFNINSRTGITVRNISFEGAGATAILGSVTTGNTFSGLDIKNCTQGIGIYRLSNSTIDGCRFTDILQTAVYVQSPTWPYQNVTISNNTIRRIGLYPGMGSKNQSGDYCAISSFVRSGLNIIGNDIVAAGIDCIKWQGSNVDISYNYCDSFAFVGQDHGAMYTFHDPNDTAYFDNRNLHHNICRNAIGAPDGAGSTKRANGIYCDGYSENVNIFANIMDSIKRSAVNLNMKFNVKVYDNVVLLQDDNSRVIGVQNNGSYSGPVRGFAASRNVFYLTKTNQSFFYFTIPASGLDNGPIQDTLQAIGFSDSNWHNREATNQYRVEYYTTSGSSTIFNLAELNWGLWTGFSGWDLNNIQPPSYGLDSVRLVYNRGRANANITIPAGNWRDVKTGTVYNTAIFMQPFTGMILTYDGVYTPPEVPPVKSVIKRRRFVKQ